MGPLLSFVENLKGLFHWELSGAVSSRQGLWCTVLYVFGVTSVLVSLSISSSLWTSHTPLHLKEQRGRIYNMPFTQRGRIYNMPFTSYTMKCWQSVRSRIILWWEYELLNTGKIWYCEWEGLKLPCLSSSGPFWYNCQLLPGPNKTCTVSSDSMTSKFIRQVELNYNEL